MFVWQNSTDATDASKYRPRWVWQTQHQVRQCRRAAVVHSRRAEQTWWSCDEESRVTRWWTEPETWSGLSLRHKQNHGTTSLIQTIIITKRCDSDGSNGPQCHCRSNTIYQTIHQMESMYTPSNTWFLAAQISMQLNRHSRFCRAHSTHDWHTGKHTDHGTTKQG